MKVYIRKGFDHEIANHIKNLFQCKLESKALL